MRAKGASTLEDKELKRAWTMTLAHSRTALWLATTICVAEAVGYLPSISDKPQGNTENLQ
jgi:hypothetical protein